MSKKTKNFLMVLAGMLGLILLAVISSKFGGIILAWLFSLFVR